MTARKERVSASGEPFWTQEERDEIKKMYPHAEGYFPVFARQSCELVPIEIRGGIGGKSFHIKRNGTPAYESRWDYVDMFDPMCSLAWARRGDEAFRIDTRGQVVSGPINKNSKKWPFIIRLEA